jgi:hypothetical protein
VKSVPALHFVVPVWGEAYVETFLKYSLPAQLAPDNIPVLGRETRSRYTIYTTPADYERIRDSNVFLALQQAIEVDVEPIDSESILSEGKYELKSRCYRAALQRAAADGAAVVALNADILLANGFVRTAVSLLARGVRVIEVPGPRGLREPIGQALLSGYRAADGIAISIEPAELSHLWIRNMHPQLQMHHVEGLPGGPFHPSHLYWSVRDEGVIIRGFHLYPVVVDPRDGAIGFNTTIDDDLVAKLGLSENEKFLARDSRDIFCCELSPPDYDVSKMAERGDLQRYVAFYLSYAKHNIHNLEKEITISRANTDSPEWDIRRKQSSDFIRRIAKLYRSERRRRQLRFFRQRLLDSLRLAEVRVIVRNIAPKPVKAAVRAMRRLLSREP